MKIQQMFMKRRRQVQVVNEAVHSAGISNKDSAVQLESWHFSETSWNGDVSLWHPCTSQQVIGFALWCHFSHTFDVHASFWTHWQELCASAKGPSKFGGYTSVRGFPDDSECHSILSLLYRHCLMPCSHMCLLCFLACILYTVWALKPASIAKF